MERNGKFDKDFKNSLNLIFSSRQKILLRNDINLCIEMRLWMGYWFINSIGKEAGDGALNAAKT
jgi:hypothetical protein